MITIQSHRQSFTTIYGINYIIGRQKNFAKLVAINNWCWDELLQSCSGSGLIVLMFIANYSTPWKYNVTKTRTFLFIWMLIASVSLIKFFWLEFPGFGGTNHDIYEHIITHMLIEYCAVFKIGIFLFVWMLIVSFYFINCCLHELQSFYGSNHIWAYN